MILLSLKIRKFKAFAYLFFIKITSHPINFYLLLFNFTFMESAIFTLPAYTIPVRNTGKPIGKMNMDLSASISRIGHTRLRGLDQQIRLSNNRIPLE